MRKRYTLTPPLLGFIIGAMALFLATPVKSETTPTVVELFTSQGCSSCPPAEALLRDLADVPGILALEFHVDYWDYIGWPDPYASPAFTQRQRRYAQFFNSRTVYTPQMVMQGVHEAPGSRTTQVMDKIATARAMAKVPLSLTLTHNNQLELVIASPNQATELGMDHRIDADIILVTYDDYRETQVTRGENAGKFLTHRHVVRSMETIGSWDGALIRLVQDIPAPMSDKAGCAVLVQAKDSGRILGAANLTLNQ